MGFLHGPRHRAKTPQPLRSVLILLACAAARAAADCCDGNSDNVILWRLDCELRGFSRSYSDPCKPRNDYSNRPTCFIGDVCYADQPYDCCTEDSDPMAEFGYHLISTAVFALLVWSIVACSCIPGNCCNGGCCCPRRVERNPALCQCRDGGAGSKAEALL